MNRIIHIVGHKNPDSDSICSAIAYSEFKRKLGYNCVPARLGKINQESQFILDYFNIESPQLLATVRTQVTDLDIDTIQPVTSDISIKTAWMVMKKNNVKTLPVIDDKERLIGIVTLSDITNKYMDALENNILGTTNTPLINIIETLNAKLVTKSNDNFHTTGKVVINAMTPEQLVPFLEKGDIVITGNRKECQISSIELGTSLLIITCSSEISEDVLEKANEKGCIILTTPHDTFTTAKLINQSIPVKNIMTEEKIISFHLDDFVDEVKEKMLQTRYRSYPVVDDNNKFKGLISRYHLIMQKRKKVILVDHNEKSQSVHGVEEAEIVEIIDHHRVGDIQTGKPIIFRNEPLGSTASIIANMFFENGLRPSKNIAGILCGAIISDTLKFKSPTSTYTDKFVAERLAEISGIDIETFSKEMFKAGSSLNDMTAEEIFYQDFKEFNFGKFKIGISQINTMNTEDIDEIKQSLLTLMESITHNKNYHLLMILLTDIINEGSELLFVGERKELISKAFNVTLGTGNSVFLPGVISRKKQVIPPLSTAIE